MATTPLKPTDLVLAARSGQCEKATSVLKIYPCEVDVQLSGKTALQEASFRGYTKIILVLLRSNADLYRDDALNRTPLHHAVLGNKPEAVQLLLKSDTRRKLIEEKDFAGMSAPQLAFKLKHKECVKVFMDWDISIKLKEDESGRVEKGHIDLPATKAIVKEEEKHVENMEGPINGQASDEPPVENCYFCNENSATIKFEPCGCQLSCFECSLSYSACGCGQPIEKCSFGDINQIKKLIKEMQRDRRLLENTQEELQEYITCNICAARPIMCTLQCGHMFCIPCIKSIKEKTRRSNAECPVCRQPSRYTVLHPRWPTKVSDIANA